MWPGPYGEWGSRKYLIASCDQSLKRMGLDYVDIFYSHRFDPDTPLEETMGALDHIVRSGKALYAGISSYNSERTREAVAILNDLGTPCLIHQPSYNMLNRWVERDGLKDTLKELGIGSIAFTPLAQGMLTNKYLKGIPEDSRAAQGKSLKKEFLNEQAIAHITQAQRDRRAPRPDAGADGAGLGAARRRDHHRADRRVATRTGGRLRRLLSAISSSPPRNSPRSTVCRRGKHQSVGAVGGAGKGRRGPMIRNPILPGFNPDPSICRAGEDYYIATSTFEWYPGVQIHHSRDLVNWTLVSRPLDRGTLLDMRGNPDSCGIWAPCLSHRRREVLARLYGRQALRRQFQGCAELHRHRSRHHRPLVRSGLCQFVRFRSLAVSR
jgi:hypothetical protein